VDIWNPQSQRIPLGDGLTKKQGVVTTIENGANSAGWRQRARADQALFVQTLDRFIPAGKHGHNVIAPQVSVEWSTPSTAFQAALAAVRVGHGGESLFDPWLYTSVRTFNQNKHEFLRLLDERNQAMKR
jgi:hypothetical protein